jgi:hypothetical protein
MAALVTLTSTKRSRRFATLAAIGALGSIGVAGLTLANAAPGSRSLFASGPLVPGGSTTALIGVAAGPALDRPYLEIHRVRDHCVSQCQLTRPSLSRLLTLSVTAPGGAIWTGPIAGLSHPLVLPGDPAGGSGQARHYSLRLALPRDTGNLGEGLATDLTFQWGRLDSRGRPVTRVLGGTVQRGPGRSAPSRLPDTGYDAALAGLAGISAVGAGVVLLIAARSRRRRHSEGSA